MTTTTTPKMKVTYFDFHGRAEAIRLALIIADIPFEDERFTKEAWAAFEPKPPYKFLPTLTLSSNKTPYSQSNAIARYVAKLANMYPTDPATALFVDEIVDTITDIFLATFRYRGNDKDLLRREREKLIAEDIPRLAGGMEKRLEEMGKDEEGGFVLGEKVSLADLAIHSLFLTYRCGILDFVEGSVLNEYPRLLKSFESVMDIPRVAEWYCKHPVPNVTVDGKLI